MVSEHFALFQIFLFLQLRFPFHSQGPSMADATQSVRISQSVTNIDESHPFFLHYGENPGAILVAQPLVNDNYPSWAQSMRRALGAKSKLGFIDGSLSLTPSIATSPLLVQAWTKCNDMVVSWILNCVSPKILASVVYKNTALDRSEEQVFSEEWTKTFPTSKATCNNYTRRAFYHRSFHLVGCSMG